MISLSIMEWQWPEHEPPAQRTLSIGGILTEKKTLFGAEPPGRLLKTEKNQTTRTFG